MNKNLTFSFEETYSPDTGDYETDAALHTCVVTNVNTRKLEAWVKDHGYEYGYVRQLIESALGGSRNTSSSRKYSFSDQEDWYASLAPDADCTDPVHIVYVDLG